MGILDRFTGSNDTGVEENKQLQAFKDVAKSWYEKRPIDSTEYAKAVAGSITAELRTVAGMNRSESEMLGYEIEGALLDVTGLSDTAITQGNVGAFNQIRIDVSEIVGRHVLPKLYEHYGMDFTAKKDIGPQDVVGTVGRVLGNEVSSRELAECAVMAPTQMQRALVDANVIKVGEYLYDDFAKMPRALAGLKTTPQLQKVIDAALLTMNAAWKSVQLGRAVSEQKQALIEYTGKGNFGTFSEMVRAMYKEGLDASGGDKKIGVLRAVFELAKDIKQIHAV